MRMAAEALMVMGGAVGVHAALAALVAKAKEAVLA